MVNTIAFGPFSQIRIYNGRFSIQISISIVKPIFLKNRIEASKRCWSIARTAIFFGRGVEENKIFMEELFGISEITIFIAIVGFLIPESIEIFYSVFISLSRFKIIQESFPAVRPRNYRSVELFIIKIEITWLYCNIISDWRFAISFPEGIVILSP